MLLFHYTPVLIDGQDWCRPPSAWQGLAVAHLVWCPRTGLLSVKGSMLRAAWWSPRRVAPAPPPPACLLFAQLNFYAAAPAAVWHLIIACNLFTAWYAHLQWVRFTDRSADWHSMMLLGADGA